MITIMNTAFGGRAAFTKSYGEPWATLRSGWQRSEVGF